MIDFWRWFWMVSFAAAGVAFVLIAAVVAVRGVGDLRRMFAALRGEEPK